MYLMYLRKSREDEEVGLKDTLDRHQKILTDLAERLNLDIPQENIFKEVVSGETIDARPEMQKMMAIVETGEVDGVLVVEVERLSRGDMVDQGKVLQAFLYSHTKIITPNKTYDPADDSDRIFFEFGLFMSRREYELINKRLTRGKFESTREGKYIASAPPYGYDRVKIEDGKGYTLVPNSNAVYVKKMYEMACQGYGAMRIANYLDSIGAVPSNSRLWSKNTVERILQNRTYCGYVSWQKKKQYKKIVDGVVVKKYHFSTSQAQYFKGLHEAIIDESTWNKAQTMRIENRHPRCNANHNNLRNPLAGILICGNCGHSMQMKFNGSGNAIYRCVNKECSCTKSKVAHAVIDELLDALKDWLKGYKVTIGKTEYHDYTDEIVSCETEIKDVKSKIDKTCALLEEGVYTVDMFKERNSTLQAQYKTLSGRLSELKASADRADELKRSQVDSVAQGILDNYDSLDVMAKNQLLKEVLVKVEYYPDRLVIFPRLPKGVS